jgi:hypothetical protein
LAAAAVRETYGEAMGDAQHLEQAFKRALIIMACVAAVLVGRLLGSLVANSL